MNYMLEVARLMAPLEVRMDDLDVSGNTGSL